MNRKKIMIALALFVLSGAVIYSSNHSNSLNAKAPTPPSESPGVDLSSQSPNPAAKETPSVKAGDAQNQPSVKKTVTSTNAIETNSPSETSRYLLKGFESLKLGTDHQRIILKSKMNERAKSLFLTGLALNESRNNLPQDKLIALGHEYADTVNQENQTFFNGAKVLLNDRENFPEDLGNRMFEMMANINPSESPELFSYSVERIQKYKSGSLSSQEDQANFRNAIVTAVSTAKDPTSGLAQLNQMINQGDQNQANAYKQAKEILAAKNLLIE